MTNERPTLLEYMRKANLPIMIEYRRPVTGSDLVVPFNVLCGNGRSYDFEWCKRDGCLYYDRSGSGSGTPSEHVVSQLVGSGAPAPIWIADWLSVVFPADGPSDFASCGWERIDRPLVDDPFAEACEAATIYCTRCDDFLPKDDTDTPCDHIWWCDRGGWRGATGEIDMSQPCRSKDCTGCVRERRARAEERARAIRKRSLDAAAGDGAHR